ncbi:(2Fe-2S) ferredoxin [Cypionkella aquatica]|uniref:(2Fe-2S) ferredoxin n=1 Tax=Cypionkella aquatica TaxID=1756042 RepID=A0AA37X001_9RHOB|nr:aromatic ring-hydroxylating dioxygenase subunit alpha [Cypionkella aquatica]GLS86329.1 (2Fe-2S) ferredoxin [Cypionkella aquatica]
MSKQQWSAMTQVSPHASSRLEFCPATLPAAVYHDADWYARESATVFAQNWICVGRLVDFVPGTMRRVQVGAADVIVCRGEGSIAAYHNSCRHRGSELCRDAVQPMGKLIRCPYHAFAYAAVDGRLVATGHAVPTADFDRATHGLLAVASQVWAGFLFLNTAQAPGDLVADVDLAVLDHWPMQDLVTGHVWKAEIACNWKVFWENYSECLHCPGIHPELCDRVPIYGQGIMAASEALHWDGAQPAGNLKPGAASWTPSGAACGPEFAGLTEAERAAGYHFVTFWPTAYVVAHVDHVRSVRIVPLGPLRTALVVEWHFSPETLAQPGFDAAEVAAFAKIVLGQDGDAAEMNQRGLMSPAYRGGTLMPEEYEIHRFHQWLTQEMEVTR